MVTFEDLPYEIRYMIIEHALPDIPGRPGRRSPHTGITPGQEFRTAVLRLARTSRWILTTVVRLLESLQEQQQRMREATRYLSRDRRGDRGDARALLFLTRFSLRKVLSASALGVTKS